MKRYKNHNIFGNNKLANIMKTECNVEILYGISDLELARLYSESMATIAPQLWEHLDMS